ncbi:F-box containing protein [Tokyovirus A1]|uniref:F-box containing protein n=1 Tax=Tokyovirus A1 TaxID=1826170 RepID=UPI0007A97ADD|nr:F-box containing protein [Tokyovirus A1]BAU80042.1 F-box containing protein [Tokyovirus A1]
MEALPNETLFHILYFCGSQELKNFERTCRSNRDVLRCGSFWSLYARERKHPKKPENISQKEWSLRMETQVSVNVKNLMGEPHFGYPSSSTRVLCQRDSARCLIDAISRLTRFAPHNILLYAGGNLLDKNMPVRGKRFIRKSRLREDRRVKPIGISFVLI